MARPVGSFVCHGTTDPIVNTLRETRIARNIGVRRLEKRIGYTIGATERGSHSPSLPKTIAWANALGFDLVLVKRAKVNIVGNVAVNGHLEKGAS